MQLNKLVFVGLAVLLLAPEALQLTVTTTSDDGDGSFRNAFNSIASGDSTAEATITFASSVQGKTISLSQTPLLTLAKPVVLSIDGGSGGVTLNGQGWVNLFVLDQAATLKLISSLQHFLEYTMYSQTNFISLLKAE